MSTPAATPTPNAVYEKLKQIRASKDLVLKPTPMLRSEILGMSGKPEPFRLRYYQSQGIFHLLALTRMVLGDGTGLGKTVEIIGALCYLWPKEPNNKVMVVAPKSAIRQWRSEILRFTTGVQVFVASGTAAERKAAYEAWEAAPTGEGDPKSVLIVNYHGLVRDWDTGGFVPLLPNGHPDPKKPVVPGLLNRITGGMKDLVIVYDEATAFKNVSTKTWQTVRMLSDRSKRVYGLTATLLKNKLEEGFSIYKAIRPDVFGTKTAFMSDYCVVKLQAVKGNRKIPIIVGYKNLQHFRDRIDPYFLGRPKHVVSDELPTLTTREITFEINKAEDAKYGEALSGILELGDGEVKDFEENKALVSLTYCQQVVDSLSLLKFDETSEIQGGIFRDEAIEVKAKGSKEQAFVDLIKDELDEEKVIVYTRFESLVGRLQKLLADEGVKSVRITGKENDKARAVSQAAFQNLESDTRVVFITDAGSEAINLQAASATIFYDAPWSWGNYIQILGRMIRIGSPHKGVLVYHLIAERDREKPKDRKTIDHHVLSLLRAKKHLIDRVLGEAAVGALEFDKSGSSIRDLVNMMKGKE